MYIPGDNITMRNVFKQYWDCIVFLLIQVDGNVGWFIFNLALISHSSHAIFTKKLGIH